MRPWLGAREMGAVVLVLALGACASGTPSPLGGEDVLVDFMALHPAAILDIRYATANNFTGKAVYPAARCLLRKPVAKKLAAAARELETRGLRLKIYDCYRPLSIQKRFWKLVPDERYVADPKKGSRHNRGAAVDIGLADADGGDLEMPTGYDDFSERAHRDWKGVSPAAAANSALLENIMARHGFTGVASEWWHFDARGGERYPILDVPLR